MRGDFIWYHMISSILCLAEMKCRVDHLSLPPSFIHPFLSFHSSIFPLIHHFPHSPILLSIHSPIHPSSHLFMPPPLIHPSSLKSIHPFLIHPFLVHSSIILPSIFPSSHPFIHPFWPLRSYFYITTTFSCI